MHCRGIDAIETKPPATPKLSQGWITVIACACVLLVAGNFPYTFGVILKPLISEFGWSRAAVSGVVTVRNIVSAMVSPIAGMLGDRFGAKRLILLGILIVVLSYLLASTATSLWQMYAFLGALTGIGMSLLLVLTVGTAGKWFGSKSGLANSVTFSGLGMAQVVVPLVATFLIFQYSWRTCYVVLGVAALVLGVTAWSFIKSPPRQSPRAQPKAGHQSGVTAGAAPDYTFSEVLRAPALWILIVVQGLASASYQMMVVHIVASGIDGGASPEAAALILTLNGVGNTAGRLVSGFIGRIGNKRALVLCVAAQALSLLLLSRIGGLSIVYVVAAIYGLAYGAVVPLVPTIAAGLFGVRSMHSIFGSINAGYTLGAGLGPFVAGYVFDTTGSYSTAFGAAGVAVTGAVGLALLLRAPRGKALPVS